MLLTPPASQLITADAWFSSRISEALPSAAQKALTAIPAKIRRLFCSRPSR